jgi:hypothetical protein
VVVLEHASELVDAVLGGAAGLDTAAEEHARSAAPP